jgi:predicted TIM-barrel fold metal-dependent hydrolase
MKIIDAHAHVGYYGSFFNVGITPEALLRQMDDHQIVKALISDLDNDALRNAVRAYPDRLLGAVWVDPRNGSKALDAARAALEHWGFKGIKLHPLIHGYVANDSIVDPFAQLAEELGVPVFVHSGHPPFSLPWSIAQLAERFPRTRLVMVHMGHGHGVYIQAAIDMAMKYENIFLETSGMPMHSKVREAYELVGANRILFGTDAPFHHPSVEIQRALVSGLGQDQLEDVFYRNAAALLGLDIGH